MQVIIIILLVAILILCLLIYRKIYCKPINNVVRSIKILNESDLHDAFKNDKAVADIIRRNKTKF